MSRPEHEDPTEFEFFSDLQTRLCVAPNENVTRVQVARAAATARTASVSGRGHMWRTVLVALCVCSVLSTSGVAIAGRLPGPLQLMVADAARLLPVPVPIPYPDDPSSDLPISVAASDTGATDEIPAPTNPETTTAGTVDLPEEEMAIGGRDGRSPEGNAELERRDHRYSVDPSYETTRDDRDFLEENGRSERDDR